MRQGDARLARQPVHSVRGVLGLPVLQGVAAGVSPGGSGETVPGAPPPGRSPGGVVGGETPPGSGQEVFHTH